MITSVKNYDFVTVPYWSNPNNAQGLIELQHNLFTTATDGVQYAEVNGDEPSMLYQDVAVEGDRSLKWSLDHTARESENTDVIQITLSDVDGSNAQSVTHLASLGMWNKVSGTYQTASGQNTVRMTITAVSGSNPRRGNFIDNVRLNYDGCSCFCLSPRSNNTATSEETAVKLAIHPNPAANEATMELNGFGDGIVAVDIINMNGQVVSNSEYNYNSGTTLHLNLSKFKSGLYVIKARRNDKMATVRFIKK